MILNILKPRLALNKAFLKVKPNRPEIELFKDNLIRLLGKIDEIEREENQKNHILNFLRDTYYKDTNEINTKESIDLVIHNGKDAKSTVGVIIEAKRPGNKGEMISKDNLNAKAFQELVLYYLRERITKTNLEIKHLIATNIYEWFIFDAQIFEKHFAQNKSLVKQFIDFEEGRLSGIKTDFFYKEIAKPAIDAITAEIPFAYFDIREYEKPLRNASKSDDNVLIALYKLLSPENLLKLPFANDSNSLDKAFYSELLHIIGLTETKDGSKKLIERKKEGERNRNSLIENAIEQLDATDKISWLKNAHQFGADHKEQIFNVALELSITWINRILFLKLLEAQLIKYNKGNAEYAFLNIDKVKNFDDLNSLFFSVLARKPEERNAEMKRLFPTVPYLNSSLFEPTELEHSCFFIGQLKDGELPLLSTSVIKDNVGGKRKGSLTIIEYIFEFLNAYNFASEGSEEIQEDNKRLINASVLGLIFEKINGYKDGSFFTPGFITMYMCRETIRRAVLQKFNEAKGWDCPDLNSLYNKISDLNEANKIVNSLKICDPAVGSGHFLVSALNEIIAIKSELGILLDRDGRKLRDYNIEVANDELVVTDEEGKIFEYNPNLKESQRVQSALFHEKQTIIENCLFGVDINPNSVKICRLRLWIELLKNAYYKDENSRDLNPKLNQDLTPKSPLQNVEGTSRNRMELETLPNIDINIKCGNSLISRYALDADIKAALKHSNWTIGSYKLAIMSYRNAKTKEEKREMERLIDTIKGDFETEVKANDSRVLKLQKRKDELTKLTTQTNLFEQTKTEKARWEKEIKKLTDEIQKLESELNEIKNNKIYENAFEWRFEFPEVLDDDGNFVGFDVVIGNPPYMTLLKGISTNNIWSLSNNNTYTAFLELSKSISSKRVGYVSFIIPNTWLSGNNYFKMREEILTNNSILEIIQLPYNIFDVYVDTVILVANFHNRIIRPRTFQFGIRESFDSPINYNYFNYTDWQLDSNKTIFTNPKLLEIYKRYLQCESKKLEEIADVQRGSLPPNESELYKENEGDSYIKWFNHQVYRYKIEDSNNTVYVDYSKLRENKPIDLFKCEKILGRQIISRQFRLQFTLLNEEYAFKKNLYAIYNLNNEYSYSYLLAILNSTFYSYVQVNFNTCGQRDDFPAFSLSDYRNFLIPHIDYEQQQPFINLVDKILAKKENNEDTTAEEQEIDKLVYKLYDLTDEEVKIVEGR
ncbi:MAG: Eco57I restriction-modification methylase domain-containing protein [bacterium]